MQPNGVGPGGHDGGVGVVAGAARRMGMELADGLIRSGMGRVPIHQLNGDERVLRRLVHSQHMQPFIKDACAVRGLLVPTQSGNLPISHLNGCFRRRELEQICAAEPRLSIHQDGPARLELQLTNRANHSNSAPSPPSSPPPPPPPSPPPDDSQWLTPSEALRGRGGRGRRRTIGR